MSIDFLLPKKAKVYARTGGRCGYCGIHLTAGNFTVDHMLPRYLGGSDDLSNLIGACRSCNGSKGKKSVEQYRLWVTYHDLVKGHRFYISHLEFMVNHLDLREKFPRVDHVFYFERMSNV